MAVTAVDVCNMALAAIGGQQLLSDLNENTRQGAACRLHYDQTLKALLRRYDWNWAITRVEIGPSAVKPAFQYGLYYELPPNYLSIVSVNLGRGEFKVERMPGANPGTLGNLAIACNGTPQGKLLLVYTALVGPDQMDPSFVDCFVLYLASKLCKQLKNDWNLSYSLKGEADKIYADALGNTDQEDTPQISPYYDTQDAHGGWSD